VKNPHARHIYMFKSHYVSFLVYDEDMKVLQKISLTRQ